MRFQVMLARGTRLPIAFLCTLAASLFCLAGCGSDGQRVEPSAAFDELINRNWLSSWPTSKDDRLHVFRFTPSMGGGVFQDRNVFEGTFELFTFEATGDRMRFRFPGREEVHTSDYRIERITEPEPFTHRLIFDDSPRGPDVFFGFNESRTASPFLADPGH